MRLFDRKGFPPIEIVNDPAAIREAALREAADVAVIHYYAAGAAMRPEFMPTRFRDAILALIKGENEMTDLIKRDDALAVINTFERNFEQPWRVQFRANINAIPEVKDERIEQLERQLDTMQDRLDAANKARADVLSLANKKQAKLAKAMEYLGKISRHANRSCAAIAARALAELEDGEEC